MQVVSPGVTAKKVAQIYSRIITGKKEAIKEERRNKTGELYKNNVWTSYDGVSQYSIIQQDLDWVTFFF